jgi:uncharacterized protein
MKKITHNLTGLLLILTFLVLFQNLTLAQESPEKQTRPSIRAMGEATIMVRPDQAQIVIGVVTQSQNAQSAAAQNAQKLDAVINTLRKILGTEAEIKTMGYSLNPIRNYPKEGGEPKITGYQAVNLVRVKTEDLTRVGAIIDAAAQSGANEIQSLQFTLKDEKAARLTALKDAAASAKAQVEAIASALNLKIVRVLSAEEGGGVVRPLYAEAAMAERSQVSAPTPVEPGTIEIRATVTLTVEIAQ